MCTDATEKGMEAYISHCLFTHLSPLYRPEKLYNMN